MTTRLRHRDLHGAFGWSRSVVALLLSAACAGCPAMAITRGAEMAAGATFDDRSYEQQADDEATKADVEKALVEGNPDLAAKVDADVYRDRIMLTGVVGGEFERRQAVELTRRAAGDAVVYDDIQIASAGGLGADTDDFVTNKELSANLLEAEGLASQSFQHRVVNGVAYILGQAQTDEQVRTARSVALGTPGVRDVVLHIAVGTPSTE